VHYWRVPLREDREIQWKRDFVWFNLHPLSSLKQWVSGSHFFHSQSKRWEESLERWTEIGIDRPEKWEERVSRDLKNERGAFVWDQTTLMIGSSSSSSSQTV
jgi:hypothetical protein